MDTQTEPPRVTRKQQRELTDKLIMDAARAAFIELGYDHTTLREIARRSGRSTGSYFNHHSEKVEVLAEVLHHDLPAELSMLEAIVDPSRQGSVLASVLVRDYEYWRSRAGLCQAWWSRHCARDKVVMSYTEEAKLRIVGLLHEVVKGYGVRMSRTRADILWNLHVGFLQNISGAEGEAYDYAEEMYARIQIVLSR